MPARTCPGCRGSRSVEVWTATDRLFGTTDNTFAFYTCSDCTLLFIWPVPETTELASYYPSRYWQGPPGAESGLRQKATELYRRMMLRDQLRFVRRAIGEQRRLRTNVDLLDVGCGDGAFLAALGHPGSVGLDFSNAAVAACRARGLEAWQGNLEQNPLPAERRFDLVTMFHFLEHVSPAEPTLAHARQRLSAGGQLVVQVPNCSSIQARVLGRYWTGYDPPRHLVNYTLKTLTAALERSLFEIVEVSYRSLRDNPTLLASSLAPRLYPPARAAAAGRREGSLAWLGDVTFLALSMACIPPTVLEAACGRGAAVTVRAIVRT